MPEALKHAREFVAVVQDRQGRSLQDLKSSLLRLVDQVSALPLNVDWPEHFARPEAEPLLAAIAQQWPELGFYAAESGAVFGGGDVPELVGCAADDLLDIGCEMVYALQLGEVQNTHGENWLRWSYDSHWHEHVRDLLNSLDCLLAE